MPWGAVGRNHDVSLVGQTAQGGDVAVIYAVKWQLSME
jgi:hypothetical protein